MNNYKLLTPGPLTTTNTVKEQMLFDRCTGTRTIRTLHNKSDPDFWIWQGQRTMNIRQFSCRVVVRLQWNLC